MKDRIEHIMRSKNLTATQLADLLNVQRSGISHIISGRNNPSLDFVIKIKETFPEFNLDWLVFGKGPMTGTLTESKKTREMSLFESDAVELTTQIGENKTSHVETDVKEKVGNNAESIESKRELEEKKEASPDEEAYVSPVTTEYKQLILVYSDDTFKVLKPRRG